MIRRESEEIEGWTFRQIGVDGYSWVQPGYWFVKNEYRSTGQIICACIRQHGWIVTDPMLRMLLSDGWNYAAQTFSDEYKDYVKQLPIHAGPKQAIVAYRILSSGISDGTFWKRQADIFRSVSPRLVSDTRVDKILLASSERGLP